ncbi:hypothetical protein [Foetidibacter luteolus]|uniref:hypothetical protein n=1 Tax=Foetidibacter luteolus TaxID=2608880 RepID=UPI00129B8D56|nr:hypothetical protein [Foetidibacter luteolus]
MKQQQKKRLKMIDEMSAAPKGAAFFFSYTDERKDNLRPNLGFTGTGFNLS